jgi:FKBP-type peptidyl-prolyl cis-trans isomerase FkpA
MSSNILKLRLKYRRRSLLFKPTHSFCRMQRILLFRGHDMIYIRKNFKKVMKKIALVFSLFVFIVFAGSCIKSKQEACTNRPVAADSSTILSYIITKGITGYAKHPSGLYYKIESAGSSTTPNVSSKIFVKYTGRFVDNRVFDSLGDASKSGWVLGSLIEGWKIGLPLISKGGKIKLFLPSALGYGCTGGGAISANSVLVFDIELVDVQ